MHTLQGVNCPKRTRINNIRHLPPSIIQLRMILRSAIIIINQLKMTRIYQEETRYAAGKDVVEMCLIDCIVLGLRDEHKITVIYSFHIFNDHLWK